MRKLIPALVLFLGLNGFAEELPKYCCSVVLYRQRTPISQDVLAQFRWDGMPVTRRLPAGVEVQVWNGLDNLMIEFRPAGAEYDFFKFLARGNAVLGDPGVTVWYSPARGEIFQAACSLDRPGNINCPD